jgi:hypothetical protein
MAPRDVCCSSASQPNFLFCLVHIEVGHLADPGRRQRVPGNAIASTACSRTRSAVALATEQYLPSNDSLLRNTRITLTPPKCVRQ